MTLPADEPKLGRAFDGAAIPDRFNASIKAKGARCGPRSRRHDAGAGEWRYFIPYL